QRYNVTGVYINSTAICCLTPSAVQNYMDTFHAYVVEVTMNGGVDYTQDGTVYTYAPALYLHSITPAQGHIQGVTPVLVSGQNFALYHNTSFINTNSYTCRFTVNSTYNIAVQ